MNRVKWAALKYSQLNWWDKKWLLTRLSKLEKQQLKAASRELRDEFGDDKVSFSEMLDLLETKSNSTAVEDRNFSEGNQEELLLEKLSDLDLAMNNLRFDRSEDSDSFSEFSSKNFQRSSDADMPRKLAMFFGENVASNESNGIHSEKNYKIGSS